MFPELRDHISGRSKSQDKEVTLRTPSGLLQRSTTITCNKALRHIEDEDAGHD
jgi:hypothetical protein